MSRYRIHINPKLDKSLIIKSWEEVYSYLDCNENRVLEIGSGLGEFLVHEAILKPGVLFLGLESKKIRVLKSTELVWKYNLGNIRFMRSLVSVDLCNKLNKYAFKEIHINHPEPWEKRRHRKRKIIRPEMLPVYSKILEDNGVLWIATDHLEYGREIKTMLTSSAFFDLVGNDYLSVDRVSCLNRIQTRFEEKLNSKGFISRLYKAVKK